VWIWYLRERPWRDFAPSFEGCKRNNSTAVSRRISLHFIPEWSYQQQSTTLSQPEMYFGDSCELVVTRLVLLPWYLSQCHKSWRSSFLDIRSYFITPDDTCLRGPFVGWILPRLPIVRCHTYRSTWYFSIHNRKNHESTPTNETCGLLESTPIDTFQCVDAENLAGLAIPKTFESGHLPIAHFNKKL
jgi:hypothetical protein